MPIDEIRLRCLLAIDHFGVEHQKQKALEEFGELIAEMCKEQDKRTSGDRIAEELADVMIMTEQLRLIYGQELVDWWIAVKSDRLMDRIRKKEGLDG